MWMNIKSWPLAALLLALALPARGEDGGEPAGLAPKRISERVGFDQKLGEKPPLDLAFRDESGREVHLADYFGRRPVLLNLVYFRCPMLCNQVLQGLTRSLKPIGMTPGREFEVVTVSIDPKDDPDVAAKKKAAYVEFYGRPEAASGWHFLTTTDQAAIDRLAASVGFRYTYDLRTNQFAHAAGTVILTPDGTISRYHFGIDPSPKDLDLSLRAAGENKVGSPISRLLMLCYDYDPATGKYTLTVMSLLRVLGAATALGMATLVIGLLVRERLGQASRVRTGPDTPLDPRNTQSHG
jgi:protein SCO1/2